MDITVYTDSEDISLVESMHPVFACMPGGGTVGDSALCCCVPCLLSAVNSLCWSYRNLIPLLITNPFAVIQAGAFHLREDFFDSSVISLFLYTYRTTNCLFMTILLLYLSTDVETAYTNLLQNVGQSIQKGRQHSRLYPLWSKWSLCSRLVHKTLISFHY